MEIQKCLIYISVQFTLVGFVGADQTSFLSMPALTSYSLICLNLLPELRPAIFSAIETNGTLSSSHMLKCFRS
jgi:hypothetical protein